MPPTSSTSGTGPERRPAPTTAEPTPLPPPNRPPGGEEQEQQQQQEDQEEDSGRGADHGGGDDTFPLPKLRLHIQDAMHPGASRFLAAVDAPAVLARSVQTVLRLLYVSPHRHRAHDDNDEGAEAEAEADSPEQQKHLDTNATATTTTRPRSRPKRPHYTPPPTRSVTLVLEDMPGVAYTKGTELDDDHKEIHLSMGYVKGIRRAAAGPTTTTSSSGGGRGGDPAGAHEIEGVLVHELVHCYQHNGRGACPGGLVEGVADWVRLSAGLGPPHWRRGTVPDRWDQGYERTAYFLDWLEGRFGRGTVRRINEALRVCLFPPFVPSLDPRLAGWLAGLAGGLLV